MKCLICKKLFNIKKTFSNLLIENKELICDSCYKRYKIEISYLELPIGKGICIYSLFKTKYCIPANAYLVETSRIYNYIVEKFNPDIILLYNNFFINQKQHDILETISSFSEKSIYIICNYMSD